MTLSDSREKILEQLALGTDARAAKLNWHEAADVAEAAMAGYDIVIASDVAYYQPDVAPLASALRSIHARVSIIVAPMHRDAARALRDELKAVGSHCVEHRVTLVSSGADDWHGRRHPSSTEVSAMPALSYRVLMVTW